METLLILTGLVLYALIQSLFKNQKLIVATAYFVMMLSFFLINDPYGFSSSYLNHNYSSFILVVTSIILTFDCFLENKFNYEAYIILPLIAFFDNLLFSSLCLAGYVLVFRENKGFNSFAAIFIVLLSALTSFTGSVYINIALCGFLILLIFVELISSCNKRRYNSESLLYILSLFFITFDSYKTLSFSVNYLSALGVVFLVPGVMFRSEMKSIAYALIVFLLFSALSFNLPFSAYTFLFVILLQFLLMEKRLSKLDEKLTKFSFLKIRSVFVVMSFMILFHQIEIANMIYKVALVLFSLIVCIKLLIVNNELKKLYVSDVVFVGLIPVLGGICIL